MGNTLAQIRSKYLPYVRFSSLFGLHFSRKHAFLLHHYPSLAFNEGVHRE